MEERMCLTKAQILESDDIKKEWVDVPEWGGGVFVKMLSGMERDRWEEETFAAKGKTRQVNYKNMRGRFCGLCMIDEKGDRLFRSKEVDALGRKSATALDRVFKVAQKLNGMTPEDIDELVKNSDGGQIDSDGSHLPPDSENQSEKPSDQ